MQLPDSTVRAAGRSAWIAAWAGVILSPIHALSRFATEEGREDLESSSRFWAEPAAERVRPLLDWADPHTVYVTYGKGWLVLILAATVCAFLVRGTRRPHGLERVAWPVALTGLTLETVSVAGDYYTPWIDESFLFIGLPGMLISLIGSLLLGIALLRRRYRPRMTAWLLVLSFPLMLVLSELVAMGAAALPTLFAWGLAGRAMAADSRHRLVVAGPAPAMPRAGRTSTGAPE